MTDEDIRRRSGVWNSHSERQLSAPKPNPGKRERAKIREAREAADQTERQRRFPGFPADRQFPPGTPVTRCRICGHAGLTERKHVICSYCYLNPTTNVDRLMAERKGRS